MIIKFFCFNFFVQANAWIKNREGKRMQVIDSKMNAAEYLRILENAMTFGNAIMMQDMGEEVDPSLDVRHLHRKDFSSYCYFLTWRTP